MSNHFMIIGTPKSGSSSLYKYLSDHPETSLSKIKEYNFFMNMGYDWARKNKTIRIKKKVAFNLGYFIPFIAKRIKKHYYQSCYKVKGKVSGDGSVGYFYFPEVPKRIKFYVPESKLILVLRNPIDRVYSNYWMHYKAQQKYPNWVWKWKSFEHFIEKGEHIKEINHYVISLKRWLQYFKLEDFLIITSEDFFENTLQTLHKVENFLELSKYHYPNSYWVSPHANKGNEYPPMNINTRKELKEYFKPYVNELEQLTNRDFKWKDFN